MSTYVFNFAEKFLIFYIFYCLNIHFIIIVYVSPKKKQLLEKSGFANDQISNFIYQKKTNIILNCN